MHASPCRVVPGDDAWRINVMYDERRHRDQLSGGDELRGGEVHQHGRTGLVHDLRRRQLPQHGEYGGDELHGLPWKYCIDGRSDELFLRLGLLRERGDALDRRVMHASPCRVVPGAGRWDDIMYDERGHRDQLSGGDELRGGEVHQRGRTGLVL